MTVIPSRFLDTNLITASLMGPIVKVPMAPQLESPARVYEDAAYRIWVRQSHRRFVRIDALAEPDRQAYRTWCHEHNDAVLTLNVH